MRFAELGIAARADGRAEQRAACPKCDVDYVDEALMLNVESGAFHCMRCQWAGRADPEVSQRPRPLDQWGEVLGRIRRLWSSSASLDANTEGARVVRAYLTARGLGHVLTRKPLPCLRTITAVPYWDHEGRPIGPYQAMVASLTGCNSNPLSVHLTLLSPNGSLAPVPQPRSLFKAPMTDKRSAGGGSTIGGAIRLFAGWKSPVLGVATTIEGALALHLVQGIPTWAAPTADDSRALSGIFLPSEIRHLYVAVEAKGPSAAARWLRERLAEWPTQPQVTFVRPQNGADLCEDLMRRAGVPAERAL